MIDTVLRSDPAGPPLRVSHLGAISLVTHRAKIPIVGPLRANDGAPIPGEVRIRLGVDPGAGGPSAEGDGDPLQGRLHRVVVPRVIDAPVDHDGRTIGHVPLALLPPHHFSHEPEARVTAAAFVRPDAFTVHDLVSVARARAAASGEGAPLDRGATGDVRGIPALDAILDVLREEHRIGYLGPEVIETGPARVSHQPVRSPDELLAGPRHARAGSCLDLSVLVAGALARLEYEPLILFTGPDRRRPDHALVGAWAGPHPRFVPVVADARTILAHVEAGRMVVTEATSVCDDDDLRAAPAEARRRARARLEAASAIHAVDVAACRPPEGRVEPLGLRHDARVHLARHETEQFGARKQLPQIESTLVLFGLCRAAGPVTTALLAAVETTPGLVADVLDERVPTRHHPEPARPTTNYTRVWNDAEDRVRREGRSAVGESDLLWALLRAPSRSLRAFLERHVAPADTLLALLRRDYPDPEESKTWGPGDRTE